MSPEQWQGQTLTGASDQYSLSVVFFQLVTGRLPFEADSRDDLQRQVVSVPPRRPRELNPGIPGPVEEVVLRAMAKRPEDRFACVTDFSTALVEAVERSRGIQLETKQALVETGAGLTAVLGLSILSPALVSVADADQPVFHQLTLNWPILVLVALVQAAVLLSIRWQLVGLLGRAFGWTLDTLDRLSREYVRIGTDPRGPLNIQSWRNAVVGSAEYIVNIVLVLLLYGLIGIPLVKTVSLAWDFTTEPLVATVVAAVVLALVAANLFAMWRISGPVVATLALALCWVFIGNMPIIDRNGFGGISLQWAAKLVIGVAVVSALLSLRRRVQHTVGTLVGGDPVKRRWSDALVNLAYLLVVFPILAVPLQKLLEPLIGQTSAAIVITVLGVALVLVMIDVLRRAQGFALAIVALFICAPMLLGLPLWDSGAVGGGLQWVVRMLIGLAIFGLLLGLRGRARRAARVLVVPLLDRQISAFYAPANEDAAEARVHLLGLVSDGLIDLLYVACAYVAIVLPLVGALPAGSTMSWLTTLMYVAFVAITGWLLYRVWRSAGAAGLGTTQPTMRDPTPAA
jgi:hypothetical protein